MFDFSRFDGITKDKVSLSNIECKRIVEDNIIKFNTNGEKVGKISRQLLHNKGFYDDNANRLTDSL